MNETKHGGHPGGDPNGGNVQGCHGPYWTRAHRDWRVWVGVILMLAAMITYVMTDDLAWGPHLQPQPPPSAGVAK